MFVVLIRKKLCIPKVRLLRRIHHTSIHNNFHKQFLDEQKCRPVRRALLYVPGHDLKKIKKLSRVKVDCAVLDCEDGVDFKNKECARSTIAENYEDVVSCFHGEIAVRVNSPSSRLAYDDISIIFGCPLPPTAVVFPKIHDPKELQWACNTLNDAVEGSLKRNKYVRVIFMIESARGLVNIKEIIKAGLAACSESRCRLDSIIFGSDDFCADLGISRSRDAKELLYARQKIVATAKAFGLEAIDMVFIDYQNSEGLRDQSNEGFQMGFTGKQIIHPDQVAVVERAFTPSSDRIEWAEALIAEFEANRKGVFTFRGQMIDMPTLLQAHNIVAMKKFINEKSAV